MNKCPRCGSTEIIPNLTLMAAGPNVGGEPVHVALVEPAPAKKPFVWMPKSMLTTFVAAICGNCGHTEFTAPNFAAMLAAHKQGYKSRQNA